MTFHCPNCNQKLNAPKSQGGWIKSCPHCRHKITVPEMTDPTTPTAPQYSEMLDPMLEEPPTPAPTANEPRPKTPLVRLTEVLLYPCSVSGLLNVVLIAAVLFWIRHRENLESLLGPRASALGILLSLYAYWYLVESIDNSIQGRTRAPKYSGDMIDPGEVSARIAYLTMVYLVCLLPASLYYLITGTSNAPFWIGVGWAAVTAPMALLGVLVLDSFRAFDPLFLLRSIVRVLPRYVPLAVALAASMVLVFVGYIYRPYGPAPFRQFDVVPAAAMSYWIVILTHLIGRFYPCNEESLDWDI